MRPMIAVFILVLLGCGVAAELTDGDIEQLSAISKSGNVWLNPYPAMTAFIEREGLVELTRTMLGRQESDLVMLGLKMVQFHRLAVLLPEVSLLLNSETAGDSAATTLVMAGVPLTDALRVAKDDSCGQRVIAAYGRAARYRLLERERLNPLLDDLRAVMADDGVAVARRRAAWTVLAGVRREFLNDEVLPLDAWLAMGERLEVADRELAAGLADYREPGAARHLRRLTQSDDAATAVLAARTLAVHFHEADAVGVLVECLGRADVRAGELSVSEISYNALAAIDDGSVIRRALRGLTREKAEGIPEAVRQESDEHLQFRALNKLMQSSDRDLSEQRGAAALSISNWWQQRRYALNMEKSEPQLRLRYTYELPETEAPVVP